MENGYHLYSFSGQLLREEPIEQFKQFIPLLVLGF
jgi:translation initiation factor 3 subunit B